MDVICSCMYGHIILFGSSFCLWGQGMVLWVIHTCGEWAIASHGRLRVPFRALWCSSHNHHYIWIVAVLHSHNGQSEVHHQLSFKMFFILNLVLWDPSKQCILVIQWSKKPLPVDVQALLRVLKWKW